MGQGAWDLVARKFADLSQRLVPLVINYGLKSVLRASVHACKRARVHEAFGMANLPGEPNLSAGC
jgi:hypothetical protein